MVQLSVGALLDGRHAGGLKLPLVVGCHSHGHRAFRNCCCQRCVVISDISVACNFHSGGLGGIPGAGAVHSGVGLVSLAFDAAIRLDLGEGVVHETAVASLVLVAVAVDQLLLREAQQGAGLDGPAGLQGAHSGECPAGAALLLVLDVIHDVLCPPVDFSGCVSNSNSGFGLVPELVRVPAIPALESDELAVVHVGLLVDCQTQVTAISLVLRVGLRDELVVLLEGCDPEVGHVGAVLLLVLH